MSATAVPGSERGHRALPHTADVILEAWGPDLASCMEEAVAALVEVYAEPEGAAHDAGSAAVGGRAAHLPPAPVESLLVDVLDEVVFALDTEPAVPVGADVAIAVEGGLDLVLRMADPASVTPTGAVPKAVARSELMVEPHDGGFRCRFLVDV